MENRAQSSCLYEAGHLVKFSKAFVGNKSKYSRKRLSYPRPCLHLTMWVNTQVQIPMCVCVCPCVCLSLFVTLPLGLLTKESNWILWFGAGAFRKRVGLIWTPWREERWRGQTWALDYHCALFSLLLCLLKAGLLSVWAGRLVREHFTSSACWDKEQVMQGYTRSALKATGNGII